MGRAVDPPLTPFPEEEIDKSGCGSRCESDFQRGGLAGESAATECDRTLTKKIRKSRPNHFFKALCVEACLERRRRLIASPLEVLAAESKQLR